jgi:hypothetical protein
MGRKSALSERQWEEIEKRLLAGESASSLAREFGVGKSTISERSAKRVARVKAAASLMVQAETTFAALDISEKISARSLADELKEISAHLASAARFGSATAHRLSGIAHAKVQEIDDAKPLDAESMETLKGIAVLTRMANDASTIGVNLLSANKDQVKLVNEPPQAPSGLSHFYGE